MRKIVPTLALSALLVFGACSSDGTGTNTNENGSTGQENTTGSTRTHAPDEATWTTYTNSQLGFSFKHPADWRMTSPTATSVNFFPPGTGGEPLFTLQKVQGQATTLYNDQKSQTTNANDKGDVTIDGKTAKGLCYTETQGNMCEYYVDAGNGQAYVITDYTTYDVYKTFQVLGTSSTTTPSTGGTTGGTSSGY